MNVQGNSYTFIYASVLVIVVAAVLSFAAIKLQPIQQKNREIEKKQNILSSVGINSTPKNAEDLYKEYIKESFVINSEGKKQEGEAFSIDLKKELAKEEKNRKLPIFKCTKNDSTFAIVPVRGKGLWGPIWGYIALQEVSRIVELEGEKELKTDDSTTVKIKRKEKKTSYSTIYGAVFDHKGETPGLGADINKDWFQAPFKGKRIFNSKGEFTPIVVKKGGATEGSLTEVDAISGGTITSKGVEKMLDDCLSSYKIFFQE